MTKTSVLIVEDEGIVAADLACTLGNLGYEVVGTAVAAGEAVRLAFSLHPRIILMDISLQDRKDGIEAAEEIRSQMDVPVIYLTAHSDSATLERAKVTEPFGFILKPFDARELATAIEMALYKHQTERRLRDSEQRLSIAKDAAQLGIFDHDAVSGIIHWDDRTRGLWGVAVDTPVTFELFLSGLHPDDRAKVQAAVDSAFDPEGNGEYLAEYRVINLFDQTERWIASTGRTFFTDGRCVRCVGTVQDVTLRKRDEEEIARLNAKLEAKVLDLEEANKDLEAFNHTVSHDLRNHLNKISLGCQTIDMLGSDKLDVESRWYLTATSESVSRMSGLIDDLLRFSRVNHAELRHEKVDLSETARAVSEALRAGERERRAAFSIAEGVVAWGDPGLLRVVLENLLGNAWKFTGSRETAAIEFGTTKIDGETVLFVRDNGIGFNGAEAENIFDPFRRLPETAAFRGHGIGLATVARIIRRHGGRVWAEGIPDRGAIIYFTLP